MLRTSVLILSCFFHGTSHAQQAESSERWEKTIRGFEEAITEGRTKPGGILFIGSSSIRMWDLGKWFPKHDVVNHGFGGSEISDSIHFFDRIVSPVRPRMIVLYAGDNDVAKGKSAEVVHRDFVTFSGQVKSKLPADTKLAFIAIKPSTKRWNLSDKMTAANERIRKTCEADEQLVYVDIWKPMLGDDGRPMPDLFLKDGLHLNDKGYRIWTDVVLKTLPPTE